MLKKVGEREITENGAVIRIGDSEFPSPFKSGLEYASPARGTWNIVHTGMLIPEAHEIFVCAASCLRGVVLTAAEMNAMDRFSTVEIKENNLLEGNLEELLIEGVSDIIGKLPEKPPAILVYTSCVHHFTGCDWRVMFDSLRDRFPDIDFVDCYMNPTLRKSGLTPDQTMRRQLYALLKPREINKKAVAIIGNDLPTSEGSEIIGILKGHGMKIHEITSCRSYNEYQEMAESSLYISYYPAAKAGGKELEKRLGGKHLYLTYSWDYNEITGMLNLLEETLYSLEDSVSNGIISETDYEKKIALCEEEFGKTLEITRDIPIAIDYTFCQRPTSVAKALLEHGFNVKRLYLDGFIDEEKADYVYLKENYPDLMIYATVNVKSRFMASGEKKSGEKWLALGQKAAYFLNTDYFVNVVEGGGMFGFEAIIDTLELMRDAVANKKDMRGLVQIKGMGCGCCGEG
ncbi:MAG: nitrogenase [Lachnospiraceae bacterium]|nr:nitrogenase [Lachnospiraceae bacterium]